MPPLPLAERLGVSEELRSLWASLPDETQTAAALTCLLLAGHGLDLGRPANRSLAIRWWSDFLPGRVRLCARTSVTLAEWSSEMARRLRGQIGAGGIEGERHRALWQDLIALPEGMQRRVLDSLEREAEACVTLARADLDLKKTAAKQRKRGDDGTSEGDEEAGTGNSGSGEGHAGTAPGAGAAEGPGPLFAGLPAEAVSAGET